MSCGVCYVCALKHHYPVISTLQLTHKNPPLKKIKMLQLGIMRGFLNQPCHCNHYSVIAFSTTLKNTKVAGFQEAHAHLVLEDIHVVVHEVSIALSAHLVLSKKRDNQSPKQ